MLLIFLAHVVAAVSAPVAVRRFGRNSFLGFALVPLAGFVWVVANLRTEHRTRIEWVPGLSMNIELRFDSLAAVLSLLVLGIGSLVLVFCSRYFEDDEPRLGLFAAKMIAFAGAMFALVISDNLLLLYVMWEATTVLSFLLVGHHAERASSRRAATQALLVTTAGGLAMLVGIVALGQRAGTYTISELLADPPGGTYTAVALVLILVGALSKSAVVPLHFWLPGAMAAPTPVSAYLHAAAMVKAGIYLVARLAPGFADTGPWRATILILGITSMLLGGWRALRATDLKLMLAFGTVSQLGLLIVLVGLGSRTAMLAGLALMLAHGLFKAALFMMVGVIEHTTGTRDMRKLARLGQRSPQIAVITALAAASMAGLPPLIGFVGKEAALEAFVHTDTLHPAAAIAALVGVTLGSILTVGYSIRFLWGAFGRKQRRDPSPAVASMHPPTALMLLAPALLSALGLVGGLAAPIVDRLLTPAANLMQRNATPEPTYHLALWHGLGIPLLLTVIVIIGGAGVYLGYRYVTALRQAAPPIGNADRAYDAVLRAMDDISLRLTATTQRGSLPVTQTVILLTFAILPMAMIALYTRTTPDLRLGNPIQLAVGLIMVAAALGATVMRNRLATVALASVVGYGSGVIFALHGAPDLALTQFLVETLLLVVFVLVLRKLPPEVDTSRLIGRPKRRIALAATIGISVATLGALALAARSTEPIATALPNLAYTEGDGRNVVNVLLVDIRAWDTLGEVSMLLIAATGVASLVFRNRRFGSAPRVSDAPEPRRRERMNPNQADDEVTWLTGSDLLDPRQRILMLEVTTRMVFPTMMVLSVYFFFAGHNAPGGGFAGGLTAGLALVLRYLAGGRYELGETLAVDAGRILGVGLFFITGTAVASMLIGAPVLSSATIEATLPVLGSIKLVTALFFDLGVYLIVVGLVLDILRSLGARLDSPIEVKQQ